MPADLTPELGERDTMPNVVLSPERLAEIRRLDHCGGHASLLLGALHWAGRGCDACLSRLVEVERRTLFTEIGGGPWSVRRIASQKAHPLFPGDTDVPALWEVDGPGEMAQLFRDRDDAVAVAAALNWREGSR